MSTGIATTSPAPERLLYASDAAVSYSVAINDALPAMLRGRVGPEPYSRCAEVEQVPGLCDPGGECLTASDCAAGGDCQCAGTDVAGRHCSIGGPGACGAP